MVRAKIEAFDDPRKIERGESLAAPSAISVACPARRCDVEWRSSAPVPRNTLGEGATWAALPRGSAGESRFLLEATLVAASPVKEVARIDSEEMRRRVMGG